jgi:apolipoprotein N-acyltransferase
MKKFNLLLLSLLSGLLMAAGWPVRGFPGLLFIGIIPLLFIEDYISLHRSRFIKFSLLFYTLPAFLIWNALTTWWIFNSTGMGAILAIFLNSLFMAIVFSLFHFSKRLLKNDAAGYACLVFYWMAFEYLHLNWSLNWPWLNLGNGFSSYYQWVEWYEFTGTFGGTLWILLVNILGYNLLKQKAKGKRHQAPDNRQQASGIRHPASGIRYLASFLWLLLILAPILISRIIYVNYHEEKHPVNVVLVQPNLDPYKEQYSVTPATVIGRIMKLAGPVLDSNTNFMVAPESAIQEDMWENNIQTFSSIHLLRDVIRQYPKLNILVGGSTFYKFPTNDNLPGSARKFTDTNEYYNAYNTAIMINSADSLQLYHKSKLTPGVESLPSFGRVKFMEKFAINLGGIVGTLGTDDARKVYSTVNTVKASPIICYESIFGEFFAEFVKNGAQVMFIITNDGWWGNTAGYRQHFSFANLRAIETRRSIGRSANTGISAFIDQRGDATQKTNYWEPAVIKGTINASSTMTFYVKHGDYLAKIAVFCGTGFFLISLILWYKSRKQLTINH